ncbi:MAG: 5'-deoxynucleotidase [Clostridia bacterium]|nr:5'-deoxynucleotidase [Clostridia bacterium]
MENQSSFFAMLSRLKYIDRWSLMRNTDKENVCEHSMQVAAITHALCVIKNKKFGGELDCGKATILALYHDMPEIMTGDMPTPVKYRNPEIKSVYKEIEASAGKTLLGMLPAELQSEYEDCFVENDQDKYLHKLVKAADKICALIKCIEEKKAGNTEFDNAAVAAQEAINNMELPEVDYFMATFIDSFRQTLDQQDF